MVVAAVLKMRQHSTMTTTGQSSSSITQHRMSFFANNTQQLMLWDVFLLYCEDELRRLLVLACYSSLLFSSKNKRKLRVVRTLNSVEEKINKKNKCFIFYFIFYFFFIFKCDEHKFGLTERARALTRAIVSRDRLQLNGLTKTKKSFAADRERRLSWVSFISYVVVRSPKVICFCFPSCLHFAVNIRRNRWSMRASTAHRTWCGDVQW